MEIRVALVEDNSSLRKNFRQQFTFYPEIHLVADYATGEAAIEGLRRMAPSKLPHIVLMDIELPKMSGIETTIILKELLPEIEILMLTVFENSEKVFQSVQAGASGYFLKDESFDEIMNGVRELHNGGAPMSPTIAQKVLTLLRKKTAKEPPKRIHIDESDDPTEFSLTSREHELLEGLVRGETYTTLAEKFFLSPHTVKTHIKNIYKKLHVHSRAMAVRVALEKGLV
ncbi:MAG: response regulator transcription factor [Ignavibacteriae bacterium]|nr:response regulator transcription factor [Ignavibacteriota bacterium]